MESLNDTRWDVIIEGTGLYQSLLALYVPNTSQSLQSLTDIAFRRALSRSGKKILHVDQNDYYGGSEAALSLQEAEEWVKKFSQDGK
jgi:Rab proteins geranylgeranyltransferase component A